MNFECLTDREKEVLSLMAKGHDNKSIAKELIITLTTAKTHVKNIYNKLGTSNKIVIVLEYYGITDHV